jgi:hypothetical protein
VTEVSASFGDPSELRPIEVTPAIGYGWVLDGLRRSSGYILLALGFLCLILGWYGAANQNVVAEQIPYVVSGGLLGLAFIVLGGRVLLIEDLRRDSGRLDRVEVMVAELHALLLARADAAGVDATGRAKQTTEPNPLVLQVISGSKTYHLPGCPLLAGKRNSSASVATVIKRGLTPCLLCEPVDLRA